MIRRLLSRLAGLLAETEWPPASDEWLKKDRNR
jgi:hypothetical protein